MLYLFITYVLYFTVIHLYLLIKLSTAPIQRLDVGGMQALSKNMQNYYSFVPSDSNRETEPSLLPKHVGVRTPGEHG